MEDQNQRIIHHLNHLLTIANDGKEGFATAADDTESPAIQTNLRAYCLDRSNFAEALEAEIRKRGAQPVQGGGPLGAIHRVWIDVKSALTSKDKQAVLSACITGDTAALNAYDKVLEDQDLPQDLRDLLSNQRSAIQDTLRSIKVLEDAVKNPQ